MFSIEITSSFSAAHALRLPDGGIEPLHGHDFHVTVRFAADQLDDLETVADFHKLEGLLRSILRRFQNQNLNDLEPFKTKVNPSAERIAEHLGRSLISLFEEFRRTDVGQSLKNDRNLRLLEVRLTEAVGCLAIWSPNPAY